MTTNAKPATTIAAYRTTLSAARQMVEQLTDAVLADDPLFTREDVHAAQRIVKQLEGMKTLRQLAAEQDLREQAAVVKAALGQTSLEQFKNAVFRGVDGDILVHIPVERIVEITLEAYRA